MTDYGDNFDGGMLTVGGEFVFQSIKAIPMMV
jgi:hypothetical protein